MFLSQMIRQLHRDESGQDVLEYALVLAVIAAAAVTGSKSLANSVSSAITILNGKISDAIASI
jgi:Flp pilus assembly pilin Flp